MDWLSGAPLFPKTRVEPGERLQFEAAGLPYFNPHSLRSTLVQLGLQVCRSPAHFRAWSQNLGHEGVLTTFVSYGSVAAERQGEIIQGLTTASASGGAAPESMPMRCSKRCCAEAYR